MEGQTAGDAVKMASRILEAMSLTMHLALSQWAASRWGETGG